MGRGYQPAQWPHGKSLQSDSRIYLDAMFPPVRRVEYHVEKTRVGDNIDYDKLTLAITTNGAIHPTEVVHYATSVLRTQLEHFLSATEIPFNEISKVEEEQVTAQHLSRKTQLKDYLLSCSCVRLMSLDLQYALTIA